MNKDHTWVDIIQDDYSTYPPEGEEVIASNGKEISIIWFLMSGEYKWMKTYHYLDNAEEFTTFVPIKWMKLD